MTEFADVSSKSPLTGDDQLLGANGSDENTPLKYPVSSIGSGIVVYSAYPANSPSANAVAINSALANGGLVELTGIGVIEFSDTLIFPSNTVLSIPAGITLKASSGTKFSMMENSAFASRNVGQGNGEGSGSNKNISIIGGGIIDPNTGAQTGGSQMDLMTTRWSNVSVLRIDCRFIDSNKGGGKYAALIHMCESVYINIPEIDVFSDGVHITGGISGLEIGTISGFCGDDLLAAIIGDFNQYLVNDQYGDMVNMSWRELRGLNTELAIIKLGGGMPFGNEGTFTTNFASDANQINAIGHGRSNGDTVSFNTTSELPSGLNPFTRYYVVNSLANSYEVALVLGGTPETITSDGAGVHSWGRQYIIDNVQGGNITGTCQNVPVKFIEDVATVGSTIEGAIYGHVDLGKISMDDPVGGDRYIQFVTDSTPAIKSKFGLISVNVPSLILNASKNFIRSNPGNPPIIDKLRISGTINSDGTGRLTTLDGGMDISVLDLSGLILDGYADVATTTASQVLEKIIFNNTRMTNCTRFMLCRFAVELFIENFYHENTSDNYPFNVVQAGVQIDVYGRSIVGPSDAGAVFTNISNTTRIHDGAKVELDDVTPFMNGYALNTKSSIGTTPGTGDKRGYYHCSNGSTWVHVTSGETL